MAASTASTIPARRRCRGRRTSATTGRRTEARAAPSEGSRRRGNVAGGGGRERGGHGVALGAAVPPYAGDVCTRIAEKPRDVARLRRERAHDAPEHPRPRVECAVTAMEVVLEYVFVQ